MTFLAEKWWWSLLAVPLLAALFLIGQRRARVVLTKIIASRLREELVRSASPLRRALKFLFQILGIIGVTAALARPIAGYETIETETRGRDLLLAIDTSRSMLATDVAPTRLARARLAAQDLLRLLPGDRVGLIAFAGSSFLQAPLTADHMAILDSLSELDASIIPTGGTDLASAIQLATEAFGKAEGSHRALVLFTDGEDLDDRGVKAAQEAAQAGIRIFTVGVGTPEGSVIQIRDEAGRETFVRDPQGNVVRSRLDSARLREIASAADGNYFELKGGASDIARSLAHELYKIETKAGAAQEFRIPHERYQWPLGAGLFCLLVSLLIRERKSARRTPVRAAAAAALFLTCTPAWSQDETPSRSPHTGKDVDPYALYQNEDYENAFRAFSAQDDQAIAAFNSGAAAYKAGRIEDALKAFGEALGRADGEELQASSHYNLGNTLYLQASRRKSPKEAIPDLKEALRNFEAAQSLRPNDEKIRKNIETTKQVIKQLEELQQQEEEQKQQGEQNQDEKQEDDQDQQQGGQQQQDAQQNQSQDNQDQGSQQQQQQNGEPDQSDQSDQSNQSTPEEAVQPERERSGDIQSLGENPKDQQTAEQQAAILEEAQAAEENRMTEAQARALLQSLQREDQRVRLLNPHEERKPQPRGPIRDW